MIKSIWDSYRPIFLSTLTIIVSLVSMSFYLGSKTETLQVVRDNQITVAAKLDYLVAGQQKRDLDIVSLQVRMEALHEAITAIQADIVSIQNDLRKHY